LYPIMQAWDSDVIKSDGDLGGTEQRYSFMLARDLQRAAQLNQQIAVMSPILVGTDGTRRMGKSLGNYIGISEDSYEMMKKFMQLPDELMASYYELLTDLPLEEVQSILAGHPKEAKVRLGKSIITEYHDADAATGAADRWQKEIGEGALPSEIPVATVPRSELTDGKMQAAALLKLTELCPSTSDARRAIKQGGAKLGQEKTKIESHDQMIEVTDGLLLWVGKKRFCKIEIQ